VECDASSYRFVQRPCFSPQLQTRTRQLPWLTPAPMEEVSNGRISFLTPKLRDNTAYSYLVTFLTVRSNTALLEAVAIKGESIQRLSSRQQNPVFRDSGFAGT
jgi:hypothetical protein